MKMSKEMKVGLLVIGALGMLIWGLHFLKGSNLFINGSTYYGVYDRVAGLNEGGPVNYKGYKIGTVHSIEIHPQKPDSFLIEMVITKDIELPSNSIAQIYSVDVMGSKAVQILMGNSSSRLSHGDTINADVVDDIMEQLTLEMKPLKDKTENLLVSMDTILNQVSSVFSKGNKDALNKSIRDFQISIENLKITTRELSKSMVEGGEVSNSLDNLEVFTQTLEQQSENIASSMEHIALLSKQLSDADISRVVAQTDSALLGVNTLLGQISNGDGTLSKLVNDQTLYLNLTDASANLDRLLADMRYNPNRYVHFSAFKFGKTVSLFPNEDMAVEKGIVFKVKVAESVTPLDIKNTTVLYDMPVIENIDGKNFIYTVGETTSYSECLKWLEKLKETFPTAEIYALEKGQPVSLKKALRKVDINN